VQRAPRAVIVKIDYIFVFCSKQQYRSFKMESNRVNANMKVNEKDVCAICMESLTFNRRILHITECGHCFHACCFGRIVEPICPCCRRPVTHEIRRQAKEIRDRLRDLRLEEQNSMYDHFNAELKYINDRMAELYDEMNRMYEMRNIVMDKVHQKYQYYRLLRKTLQGQLNRVNYDIRAGKNMRKLLEASKIIGEIPVVENVVVRSTEEDMETEADRGSFYVSEVSEDTSNLYQAEGLNENLLFADLSEDIYQRRVEDSDAVLSSVDSESEVESEPEPDSFANEVEETEEIAFLTLLFSKMNINRDEFLEHYDVRPNPVSLRYSSSEL